MEALFTPIVKENGSGTLKLLLSRSVFRDTLLNGKLLGIFGLYQLYREITFSALILIVSSTLSSGEIIRMLLFS